MGNGTTPLPSGAAGLVWANFPICESGNPNPTVYVTPGSTVNITFPGTAPFNLSYWLSRKKDAEVYCDPVWGTPLQGPFFIQINTSTYTWAVPLDNYSAFSSPSAPGEPWDSVTFHAIELQPQGFDGSHYPYFVSDQYQFHDSTSGSTGKSTALKSASLLGWVCAALAVASMLGSF